MRPIKVNPELKAWRGPGILTYSLITSSSVHSDEGLFTLTDSVRRRVTAFLDCGRMDRDLTTVVRFSRAIKNTGAYALV